MATKKEKTRTASVHTIRLATGWDPYEVWRTRVLEPRLGAAERKPGLATPLDLESEMDTSVPFKLPKAAGD